MLNKVRWLVTDFTISQMRQEDTYLYDRRGTPYYRYPLADTTATFEITGRLEWEGRAWSKEKTDGLIPYLNQKLREYEDAYANNEGLHG